MSRDGGVQLSQVKRAEPALSQVKRAQLYYTDRGMTSDEISAVRKSKVTVHPPKFGPHISALYRVHNTQTLGGEVVADEKEVPSLVDKFMAALKEERGSLEAFYDYTIAPEIAYGPYAQFKAHPAAPAAGALRAQPGASGAAGGTTAAEKLQQLAVVMRTCVSCVAECPAYVKKPFKAASFGEFQSQAMDQCAQCFHGVAGPCPANQDNHGVLSAVRGAVSLASAAAAAAHPAAAAAHPAAAAAHPAAAAA
eukprot:CAMPEP_0172189010 /NCGR_PEP_ID=MMETSP1050-20130122/22273_1 /TAXON_ID=233186 /ORGANISM="Cryptomonas curvata, Strain CCAP979/52" /LENGTH=250 /DNA_ID=CAMNT_0012863631 /DNA_START=142 /DNA_END=891 /DNA_ORIENTATION=+